VAAIQPAMLSALKGVLQERFVSLLSPLEGGQTEVDKRNKQISRAFNAFVVQKLCDTPVKEAVRSVVDDFNDNGIDAIYYHKASETLYLIQSKLRSGEQFSQDEAQAFSQGVRLLLQSDFDTFNSLVQGIQADIEHALDHCERIQLVVAYTGASVSLHAQQALTQLITEQQQDEERLVAPVLYKGAEWVENCLRNEQALEPVNSRISLEKHNKVEEPRTTYYGLIRMDDLVNLHQDHGKSLYQKNIRYFIGAGKRGVNRAIKATLEQSPQDFVYLNNGITAVCNKVDPKRSKGGYKDFNVRGLSIINGAQTVASAAEFKAQNPEVDTSTARVMFTLIKASDTCGFHKQVTRARNLQNPVDLGNFAALDETQEKLRQEIALHGYEYRYRPESSVTHHANVIEIEELAKSLACLTNENRYPSRLKSEPSVFTYADNDEYKAVFFDDLNAFTAINSVRVYRIILSVLKASETAVYSPEKLVYRHCGYVLAFVLMKQMKNRIKGKVLLAEADIRALVSAPLDELRQSCFDNYQALHRGYAPHSIFKKVGDTAGLINRMMIQSQNMADDINVKNLQGQLRANDPYNQALTNYLAGQAPQI